MSTHHDPSIIAFEIIERCNLYCDFCVRNANSKSKGLVSEQTLDALVDQLACFDEPPGLAITGGEPLMHPHVEQMCRRLDARRVKYCITTNGTIPRPALLDSLSRSESFQHFLVSIDSADPAIHNKIRGGRNSLAKTVRFTESLKQRGLRFLVNLTVNEENLGTVYETIQFARELGASDVSVATVKPHGRGEATLSQQQLAAVADQIKDAYPLMGERFLVRPAEVTYFLHDQENFAPLVEAGMTSSCSFGASTLHIQASGNILGCTSCDVSLGNFIGQPEHYLATLWHDHPVLAAVRTKEHLKGACGACDFKEACGGCRCRAFALNGDLFGEDPYCPIVAGEDKPARQRVSLPVLPAVPTH